MLVVCVYNCTLFHVLSLFLLSYCSIAEEETNRCKGEKAKIGLKSLVTDIEPMTVKSIDSLKEKELQIASILVLFPLVHDFGLNEKQRVTLGEFLNEKRS